MKSILYLYFAYFLAFAKCDDLLVIKNTIYFNKLTSIKMHSGCLIGYKTTIQNLIIIYRIQGFIVNRRKMPTNVVTKKFAHRRETAHGLILRGMDVRHSCNEYHLKIFCRATSKIINY